MSETIDVKRMLDEIVATKGIEVIREYVKEYNKIERRKQIRVNKKEDIALKIYDLVQNGYDVTRAIEKVAEDNHINEKTAKNHKDAFYREAKEDYFKSYAQYFDTKVKTGHRYEFNPIQVHTDEEYQSHFYSNDKQLKNYNHGKLLVYDYLFTKVFPTKNKINEEIESIENKIHEAIAKESFDEIPF